MAGPKRIKVSTEAKLRTRLTRHAGFEDEVMIVTADQTSKTKHVSSAQVRAATEACGWTTAGSQTLPGGLLGHVVRRT